MPPKEYLCKKCGDMHKRPINSKCPFMDNNSDNDSQNDLLPGAQALTPSVDSDLNMQILAELKSLGGRMTAMEQQMAEKKTEDSRQPQMQQTAAALTTPTTSAAQLDQVVVPSMAALQNSDQIQAQVDQRIRQLAQLNESGKFKSQRGGSENIWVKKQVAWPQNFILGGNNKSRVSYDSLNLCQWVSGFAMMAREEVNMDKKNAMLDYLGELMEDANDFSWQSAKSAHAVLLCRMEEGKVEWTDTSKIDRIRRAHAQRPYTQNFGNNNSKQGKIEGKSNICRFYQRGMCQNQRDHETGGFFYRHICATCYTMGKEHRHMAKDCRASSKFSKNE